MAVADEHYQTLLKSHLRKLITLENLFLNLSLISLTPEGTQDRKVVVETLEDIEELKECFVNLGLDKVPSLKKAKTGADFDEAKSILIDFLTSMLAKPQSFLRDVANNCFKQFAPEFLDEEALGRLITIVATPNQEADGFMHGEAEDESSSDLESGSEVMAGEESSDLSD